MVGGFQGQQTPLIRDHYLATLDAIMAENGIERGDPGYMIPPDADFETVVRYTDWYCRGNVHANPHYRYRRYREVVGLPVPTGRREALVDIGCGAGMFSWAFLDWAAESDVTYDRIDLYGLDHSPQMINLAHLVRGGLVQHIDDYPVLRYTHDVDTLLQELYVHYRGDTDYTITFGHVLVQAQTPDAILDFTRVISQVLRSIDYQSNCMLMAVDARRQPTAFARGWDALLNSLARVGVAHELGTVPFTAVNDPGCAKIARLFPAGR